MRIRLIVSLLSLSLLATACDKNDRLAGFDGGDSHDRYKQLTREDFRELNDPKPVQKDAQLSQAEQLAPIPDIADILAAPRPPKISQGKLVSISVTDDVPLRDVLFELSRLADVDIELGNGITGGVNFRAKDKPFNDVIERISDLAGLRYSMRNGVLRVERDTPYIKNYSLDFLNIVRSSQSSISLSTDVLSSSVGGSSDSGGSSGGSSGSSSSSSSGSSSSGIQTGTTSSVTSTGESDLWAALDASVSEILNYSPGNDSSAPATEANASAGATPSQAHVINRQAGILSVNATERQHEMVAKFLTLMQRNASAQVLIEAKVVEVTLNDEFRTGVNWDAVLKQSRINANFTPTTAVSPTSGFSFTLDESSSAGLDDIVNLTQQFGTTRTLSSPRLHAINNQQAVLTFAENRIFFTCNQNSAASTTTGTGSTTTTGAAFQCSQGSVPIGILMSILPTVNLETSEVTLNVRPTLSRQVGTKADPGTAISIASAVGTATGAAATALSAIDNAIPVVEVRELDSIMKVKNGGVMVIGGLLEEVNTSTEGGVPVLSEVPWVGNAFKSRNDDTQKRELIIFIKATIVDSSGNYAPADKSVYEKFTTDPRPLNL